MKFSYQWLSELVEDLDIDAKEVSRRITLHTAESEGVEPHGALWTGACPATVLSAEPIPNSHNVKAEVDTAAYGRKTVACGAPNCRAGLRTIYVPLGVKKVSGIDSDGMLASMAELGVNADHDGIIELSEDSDNIALEADSIIEIDNKSLTHRPDLWGHYGMARELAAILNKPLVDPVSMDLLPTGAPTVKVVVEDPALCPRFSAQLFENVTVGQAPVWLQYRLRAIGLNSISNIVDVTNWLLAELPQPTHAYDADKVKGAIVVRKARTGEKILALNGEEYSLTVDFNASAVRKTSSRLKLRTDASMRFEKAQDPENTLRAIARGAELFELVSPGIMAVGGPTDVRAAVKPLPVIDLDFAWLNRKLGRVVEQAEVVGILERLAFVVQGTKVTVPSWRATKDVSIADDLVEEIGRMVGYATITPIAPAMPVVPPPVNEERRFFNRLRIGATQQGFDEVYNYSFISEAQAAKLGVALDTHVRVLNPIASDQSLMRTTLLHGALKNFEDNRRHFGAFRFFEIGKEIHKRAEGLPEEVPHLVAGVYNGHGDGAEGLRELERLMRGYAPVCEFRPTDAARAFEHPLRGAEVWLSGEHIGRLFEFHPNWVEGRAAVLDINLDKLARLSAGVVRYQPIRRFPASEFDLSVLTEPRVIAGTVEAILRGAATSAVEKIEFVRDFTLPDGHRSLSFRATVANRERTMTQEEINAERDRLIAAISAAGMKLR